MKKKFSPKGLSARTLGAVGIQIAIMLAVVVPPLFVRATGTITYLETAPIDPRDPFRGDYVALGYRLGEGILPPDMQEETQRSGKPIHVTLTTGRPGRLVAFGLEKPILQPGQVCLVGRARRMWNGGAGTVDFPQIAQFFVPEGKGRELEEARGEHLLAKVVVSKHCNAVLLSLEEK